MRTGGTRIGEARTDLRAVLFLDACSYSRLMRQDEVKTLRCTRSDLKAFRAVIERTGGKVVSVRGDGLFAVFESARAAVECALGIQVKRHLGGRRPFIDYRIGIHLGDTVHFKDDVSGDAVNVAARIEAIGEPGTVMVSRQVRDAIQGRPDLEFISIGTPYLKNIGRSIEVFRVVTRARKHSTATYTLHLIGVPSIEGPDGGDIPVSEELMALLAVLAVAPDRRGPRRDWLRDLVWEAQAKDQREACLAKVLREVSTLLGADRATLFDFADDRITLNKDVVDADVFHIGELGTNVLGRRRELLNGFDFGGARFRKWLHDERSLLRSSVCLHSAPTSSSLALEGRQVWAPNPSLHLGAENFVVAILPGQCGGDSERAGFVSDIVANLLSKSLAETDALDIRDYRPTPGNSAITDGSSALRGPDLFLQCGAWQCGEMLQVTVTAIRPEDRKIIWSQSIVADQSDFLGMSSANFVRFVGYATDALLTALSNGRHMRDPAAHHAAKKTIAAVHHLLTMTGPGLDQIESAIATAYEVDPKPVYIAWLAYMTTFHVGERYSARSTAVEERARELARKALEADSHNGTVLGLVAHVHSYVFKEFAFAEDLVNLALESSPYRSICWDTASLLYSYTGRASQAMAAAEKARSIGRNSPYRHLFDGACCVASLVNGRFEDAVRYGESVMAVQPEFKSVLRYLTASFGHLGDIQRGAAMFRKLMALEPDLSVECIRDAKYPVPSRQSVQLLESGLTRVGLPRHV